MKSVNFGKYNINKFEYRKRYFPNSDKIIPSVTLVTGFSYDGTDRANNICFKVMKFNENESKLIISFYKDIIGLSDEIYKKTRSKDPFILNIKLNNELSISFDIKDAAKFIFSGDSKRATNFSIELKDDDAKFKQIVDYLEKQTTIDVEVILDENI